MTSSSHSVVTITEKQRAELLPLEIDASPLGPQEIAGRTLVSLISAGTELSSSFLGLASYAKFPSHVGYAAVFEVEEVGNEVTGWQRGDLAFAVAGHRSYQRMEGSKAVKVPRGVLPEAAAFTRLMGVGMTTLITTTARPGDLVLVTGLGLVGHLAARIFALCGYRVIGCDPAPSRRDWAQSAGLANVLPAVPLDDPEVAGQVALVLECSGHEGAALDGCRAIRQRGEVVLVGTPWQKRTDLTAHELVETVFRRYAVLRSGWEWELPHYPTEFRAGSLFGNYQTALSWLAQGRFSVDGLWQSVSPREAQDAYQDLLDNSTSRLATIFDWRQLDN